MSSGEYGSVQLPHAHGGDEGMEPRRGRGAQAAAAVAGLCALALVGAASTWGRGAAAGPVALMSIADLPDARNYPDEAFNIHTVKPKPATPWSAPRKAWGGDIDLDPVPSAAVVGPQRHVPEFFQKVAKIMGRDVGMHPAVHRLSSLEAKEEGKAADEKDAGHKGGGEEAEVEEEAEELLGGKEKAVTTKREWEPPLVESTFGEEENELTKRQLTQFKAMTCGVGACDKDVGCSSEAFHSCMEMEQEERVKFLQAKLPFLRVLDGYVTQLPEDKAVHDAKVEGRKEEADHKAAVEWNKDDLAANCGAFACVPDNGCDNSNFHLCMAESPEGPAEDMVSPDEQEEMVEKSDAQFQHLAAKARRVERGSPSPEGDFSAPMEPPVAE